MRRTPKSPDSRRVGHRDERSANRLHHLLPRIGWAPLCAIVVLVWSASVLLFAVVYSGHVGTASTPMQTDLSIGRLIYFSGVTQATVGYGDVVPVDSMARILVVAQSLFGTLWIAVTTAVVATRLLLPSNQGIVFSRIMGFDPTRHRFQVPVIVRNHGVTARIEASLHGQSEEHSALPLDTTSVPYFARQGQSITVRTKPIAFASRGAARYMPDPNVTPQPADVHGSVEFLLEVAYTTSSGSEAFAYERYSRDRVMCGTFSPEGEFFSTDAQAGGDEFCRRRCLFGPSCRLPNKVAPVSSPASRA